MLTHKGTITIETTRLILRRFELSDAEDMLNNWANDSEVTRYLTWQPHGNIEVTKEVIKSWVNSYENNNYYHWAMVTKDFDEVIGSIGLMGVNDDLLLCEAGYCMSKDFWGKGLMTEALRALIKFSFEECNFNRIQSLHDVANPASGKVMQKCGMLSEGILRQSFKNNSGELVDVHMYSILKQEWENKF